MINVESLVAIHIGAYATLANENTLVSFLSPKIKQK